jgi:hypothetical protein
MLASVPRPGVAQRLPQADARSHITASISHASAEASILEGQTPVDGPRPSAPKCTRGSVGVAFFIPVGCVVSYLVWRNQRWKWDTAHQRVDFISAEDARDHDVHGQRGAQRKKKKRRVKN